MLLNLLLPVPSLARLASLRSTLQPAAGRAGLVLRLVSSRSRSCISTSRLSFASRHPQKGLTLVLLSLPSLLLPHRRSLL
ncbi:hypothetical protein CGRA01v4_00851 [Colletotrichum graminicola]|nr:hypothetical protein CGRA01v4_00851 [Colletotrichum graminicola]